MMRLNNCDAGRSGTERCRKGIVTGLSVWLAVAGLSMVLDGRVSADAAFKPEPAHLQDTASGNPGETGKARDAKTYSPPLLPQGVIPATKPVPFPRNQKIRIWESQKIHVAERFTQVQPIHEPPAKVYKPLKIIRIAKPVSE